MPATDDSTRIQNENDLKYLEEKQIDFLDGVRIARKCLWGAWGYFERVSGGAYLNNIFLQRHMDWLYANKRTMLTKTIIIHHQQHIHFLISLDCAAYVCAKYCTCI